jgi:hypothetical protein
MQLRSDQRFGEQAILIRVEIKISQRSGKRRAGGIDDERFLRPSDTSGSQRERKAQHKEGSANNCGGQTRRPGHDNINHDGSSIIGLHLGGAGAKDGKAGYEQDQFPFHSPYKARIGACRPIKMASCLGGIYLLTRRFFPAP